MSSENLSGNHISDEEYVDESFEERVADILQKRHRWRWRAMSALWIISAIGWIGSYEANKHRSQENHKAVIVQCAQRHDLDQRIENTAALLRESSDSKFIFGIPRKLIVQGLTRDRDTRENLEILDCPKEDPKGGK